MEWTFNHERFVEQIRIGFLYKYIRSIVPSQTSREASVFGKMRDGACLVAGFRGIDGGQHTDI